MDNPILEAINLHFAAKKAEAIARLNVYVRNPVGVGEHPDIVGEAIKAVELVHALYASAEQNIWVELEDKPRSSLLGKN